MISVELKNINGRLIKVKRVPGYRLEWGMGGQCDNFRIKIQHEGEFSSLLPLENRFKLVSDGKVIFEV